MTTMTKKEALLKAAKELFGECGYTETTFKIITELADVALGPAKKAGTAARGC